ncbi:MAG: (2Fe-2S)-binding protein [Acidimicrobiales bacterium]
METTPRPGSPGSPPPSPPAPLRALTLTVNGQPHPVAVEPRRVLLDVLRRDLGLTGTKEVCEMGNCGACTVLLDDEAVYSCLVLAVECEGQAIGTVEGLARGQELSVVQEAFVACDALQCGFCTPGQILAMEAALRRRPDADEATLTGAVAGNLCRCGAYRNIVAAAHRVAASASGGAA